MLIYRTLGGDNEYAKIYDHMYIKKLLNSVFRCIRKRNYNNNNNNIYSTAVGLEPGGRGL